jgi:hypothetical protein
MLPRIWETYKCTGFIHRRKGSHLLNDDFSLLLCFFYLIYDLALLLV